MQKNIHFNYFAVTTVTVLLFSDKLPDKSQALTQYMPIFRPEGIFTERVVLVVVAITEPLQYT